MHASLGGSPYLEVVEEAGPVLVEARHLHRGRGAPCCAIHEAKGHGSVQAGAHLRGGAAGGGVTLARLPAGSSAADAVLRGASGHGQGRPHTSGEGGDGEGVCVWPREGVATVGPVSGGREGAPHPVCQESVWEFSTKKGDVM